MMLETNKLYHGDCLEVMKDISDNSIDMVCCDLPYQTTACKWDTIIPFEPLWAHYKRIIKHNGVIALTASQPFTSFLVTSNPGMFKYEWIWNKVSGSNFMNLKNRPLKTQEQVLIFSKTANFTFNPERVYRTELSLKRDPVGKSAMRDSDKAKVEHYGSETNGGICHNADGKKHPIDIIKFTTMGKERYKFKHPTKKPVALFEYLIKTYTNKNDLVLDNCAGSGTTGVACENLDRNYIMIEQDTKYCEIIEKRMRNLKCSGRQISLFE